MILKEERNKLNSPTIEKAKRKAENDIIEKVVQEDIISFIKKEYPVSGKIKLDIRHLWGRCYRLNFWEKSKIKDESNIIKSYFISISNDKDGLKIRNYDKKDVENN